MLNPVQKNFKKQMSQLNKEGKLHESNYNISRKRNWKKPTWAYSFIGVILFLLAFSNLPMKIYNDFIVYKHGKIHEYVSTYNEQNQIGSNIITDSINSINNSDPLVSLENINIAISNMKEIKNEIDRIKPPKDFMDHKIAFQEVIVQRLSVLRFLEIGINTNSLNNDQLQFYLQDLAVKSENERQILINSFESANMEYTILEDGTIKFWYKKSSFDVPDN